MAIDSQDIDWRQVRKDIKAAANSLNAKVRYDVSFCEAAAWDGVAKAIQKFDPTKGKAFRSFYIDYIRWEILRALKACRFLANYVELDAIADMQAPTADTTDATEARPALSLLFDALTESEAKAVRGYFLKGQTMQELAGNRPHSLISWRIKKALAKMKKRAMELQSTEFLS